MIILVADADQIRLLVSKPSKKLLDFLQTKSINAGVLILKPKQKDTQEPHSLDEIYYIIKGEGCIQIGEKVHPFQSGMCIFVPSNTPHRFFDNNSKLVVLYFFFR